MPILISDEFKTKFGTIKTWLESDIDNSVAILKDDYFITNNHKITLQKFELPNDFLPSHMNFESSRGWRWFIEKINNINVNLTLFCQLIDTKYDILMDYHSGECLDAIELANKTHHLHIGTEDGEAMYNRASYDNFMPQRFKEILDFDSMQYQYSFTEYMDFGFKTNIPQLLKNEKIYFHSLVATNPIKMDANLAKSSNKLDANDPRYRDLSTWFAVDRFKSELDEYLSKNNTNKIN